MMSVIVEEQNEPYLRCHLAMLPNLGFFARIFIKKVFMVLLSFIGLSISLMCIFLPGLAYSALLIWLAYVEFGGEQKEST